MNDPWIEQVHRVYSSFRRGHPDGTPITVICIGSMQTLLVYGKSIMAKATIALDIGSQKTATDHFKHRPPTPGEMEHAIMSVEDEIAKATSTRNSGKPWSQYPAFLSDEWVCHAGRYVR